MRSTLEEILWPDEVERPRLNDTVFFLFPTNNLNEFNVFAKVIRGETMVLYEGERFRLNDFVCLSKSSSSSRRTSSAFLHFLQSFFFLSSIKQRLNTDFHAYRSFRASPA